MYDCSETYHAVGLNEVKYHQQNFCAQQGFRPNSFNRHGNLYQENPSYNYEYWCETCDKGFKTLALLEIHKQHHQKCNIDGCQFIAHPKVITKHIQMQHSTGLYKKIANLNDPEEIKKWREERKRKYPTKENIEKKVAEIKEKIHRGEKMGIRNSTERTSFHKSGVVRRDFGSHKKPQQSSKYPSKRFDSFNNKRKRPLNVEKCERYHETKKTCKTIVVQEEPRKLKPFGGIQNLLLDNVYDNESTEECEDLIEDDEYLKDVSSIQESKNTSKPLVCGALTSLMCDYESSDEDDVPERSSKSYNTLMHNDEIVENGSIPAVFSQEVNKSNRCDDINSLHTSDKINDDNKNSTEQHPNQKIVHLNFHPKENEVNNQYEKDNDSGPEEMKVIKAEPNKQNNEELTNVREYKYKLHKFKKDTTNNYRTFKRKLPSTLLEKLLHKEIQQERNIVLQCIRYIVKSDYFNKTTI